MTPQDAIVQLLRYAQLHLHLPDEEWDYAYNRLLDLLQLEYVACDVLDTPLPSEPSGLLTVLLDHAVTTDVIPIDTIIVFTFVLGSAFAGLAGLLFAMSYPVLEPFMGMLIGWKAFIAAVVGGIGDIKGAFVGGFLLGFIEVGVVTVFPSTYRDLFAFTILLLILWMKPTGLFGMPQSTKI